MEKNNTAVKVKNIAKQQSIKISEKAIATFNSHTREFEEKTVYFLDRGKEQTETRLAF